MRLILPIGRFKGDNNDLTAVFFRKLNFKASFEHFKYVIFYTLISN